MDNDTMSFKALADWIRDHQIEVGEKALKCDELALDIVRANWRYSYEGGAKNEAALRGAVLAYRAKYKTQEMPYVTRAQLQALQFAADDLSEG